MRTLVAIFFNGLLFVWIYVFVLYFFLFFLYFFSVFSIYLRKEFFISLLQACKRLIKNSFLRYIEKTEKKYRKNKKK